MNDWELIDEDFDTLWDNYEYHEAGHRSDHGWEDHIAQAAQQKLFKHLHEPCHKHDAGLLRLGCPECLRGLRKEFGL